MTTFYDIPPEVLLEIFIHLDYFTLNKIRTVCRLFDVMIQGTRGGRLAEILFRHSTAAAVHAQAATSDANNPSGDNGNKTEYIYEFHPCIPFLVAKYHASEIQLSGSSRKEKFMEVEEIGFLKSDPEAEKFISLESTTLGSEQALSRGIPAEKFWASEDDLFNRLPFVIYCGPKIPNVTVRELVERLAPSEPVRSARPIMHTRPSKDKGYEALLCMNMFDCGNSCREQPDYEFMFKDIFGDVDVCAEEFKENILPKVIDCLDSQWWPPSKKAFNVN